jgi:hypothetical protein
MKTTTGHLIRISGLLIEMLGVWGVFNSTGAISMALHLPGGGDIPLAWLAVGVGFALWLTGTIVVYFSRPARKTGLARFRQPANDPPVQRSP